MLSAGQPLASVGGRLISLPAAPARDGRAWFVPVDFVARALAPALGYRVSTPEAVAADHRRRRADAADRRPARATRRRSPDSRWTSPPPRRTRSPRKGTRLLIRFEADALDATLPSVDRPGPHPGVRPGDTPASLVVDLGPRFASFRTADAPGDRGSGRIVIDVAAQTTRAGAAAAAPRRRRRPAAPELPPLLDLRAGRMDSGRS